MGLGDVDMAECRVLQSDGKNGNGPRSLFNAATY